MTLHRKPWIALVLPLCFAAGASPRRASASERFAATEPYTMSVVIDGVPAPEYAGRGRVYVEALRGRNFSLRISNPTPERVAVALSVDGRNVIDANRSTAGKATKWILQPWQTADIPGWQVSGETSRRFFFTETRHSYARWLGDTANVGTIEAVFFRERHPVPDELRRQRRDSRWEGGASEENGRTAAKDPGRTPSAPAQANADAPESEARDRAAAGGMAENKSASRPADTFAATGIGDRTAFSVQWVSFDEDPTPAARVSLRYEFRAELVRLGIFPREDDLYARDRGRGFEREYAPDPDRRH